MLKIVCDYETRSELNVAKVGGVTYAMHPSTEIICLGFAIGDDEPELWTPGLDFPSHLADALMSPAVRIVAHNALFEYNITKWVLTNSWKWARRIPINRYSCTAAKAAACALPRNLEGAALAMKLPVKKNMDGRRLMQKHMKPRPKWVKTGEGPKWYEDEFERWAIHDYCLTDVIVERYLDKALPELSPFEREVWLINQEMNLRGVQIDTESARHIVKLTTEYTGKLQERVGEITGGEIDSILQRDKVLVWLKGQGLTLKDLRADTVAKVLACTDGVPDQAREVLTIRQAVSKTSNKKYTAMLNRAGHDGRVCDLALYHGASTGREAGRGLQVHNLPRGKIKNTNLAIDIINGCETAEDVELFYKKPMDAFSSCVRGMITASFGLELAVADFNAIEARTVNWIADNQETLNDFIAGRDPYKKEASRIFKKAVDKINDDERFIGKQCVLGCGYGMGWEKFISTCEMLGKPGVTPALAKLAVSSYREHNQKVVQAWSNIERVAIRAVKEKGKKFSINKTTWYVENGFLWCVLPSGRRLAFRNPSLRNEKTPWGEFRPKLYHWRTHPKTKKWVEYGTYGGSLVESICQATARDITVNGIRNAKDAGYHYLFQVHDEIICERKLVDVDEYIKLLTTLPTWAKGLPVKAGGWKGFRYRK